MSESAIVKYDSETLQLVRRRIVKLLPTIAKADEGTQLAVALVTVNYGMDPFMGDVWAIPKKVGGKFVGWGLMFGIRALRKVAFRSGQYDRCVFRWLTEDEAELLDVDLKKGCKGIACEVWRRDCSKPFVGYGVVMPDDPSKMNHGKLAKLRAERAALRMAFPVELPGVVESLAGVEIEDEVIEEQVVEGELVQEEEEGAGGADEREPRSARQDMLDLGFEP